MLSFFAVGPCGAAQGYLLARAVGGADAAAISARIRRRSAPPSSGMACGHCGKGCSISSACVIGFDVTANYDVSDFRMSLGFL